MTFRLEGIDHVAIAVRDVQQSVKWYGEVLGLPRQHEDVWGNFPAIVGCGGTALALFPVASADPKPPPARDVLAMRHIAFRPVGRTSNWLRPPSANEVFRSSFRITRSPIRSTSVTRPVTSSKSRPTSAGWTLHHLPGR